MLSALFEQLPSSMPFAFNSNLMPAAIKTLTPAYHWKEVSQMANLLKYSIPFKICLILLVVVVESRKRLSQLEGQQRAIDDEQTKDDYAQQQQPEFDAIANGNQQQQQDDGACQEGWLNFQNRLCFVSIKEPQLPFFFGNTQCASFGANYTSVHSLDEFQFITANFNLHQLWIGVVYGSDQFQDGTAVESEVMRQIAPLVPWTDPSTPKGFICKAFANNYSKLNANFIN